MRDLNLIQQKRLLRSWGIDKVFYEKQESEAREIGTSLSKTIFKNYGACSYKIFESVILSFEIILSMDISIFINTTTYN